MTTVTISDIGHALIALDTELDRLQLERENMYDERRSIEKRLEQNRARQEHLRKVMIVLMENKTYEVIT